MKKIVLAIAAMMVYNSSFACQTTTVMSPDGKIVTCMVCPTVVICN